MRFAWSCIALLALAGCVQQKDIAKPKDPPPHYSGTWTYWYANGQKFQATPYVNGVRHGQCVHWHPNGQVKRRGNMVNGKGDGKWTEWDENGNVLSQEIWSKGEGHYSDGRPILPPP
jgi:antitoxin component YwqK of YwqJK toxin-antitoxin module